PAHTLTFSGQSALAPELAAWLDGAAVSETTLPLLETDLDRPVTIWQVDTAVARDALATQFTPPATPSFIGENEALELLGYQIVTQEAGDTAVFTLWRVHQPLGEPDAVLFTQQIGQNGLPISQEDRLDVPSDQWQTGDWFVQLHHLPAPPAPREPSTPFIVGLYRCNDALCQQAERYPTSQGDTLPLSPAP
ncbi:MAG: hypothetical protein KDD89_11900, partial [Anaerolineales bacterium]|nr:hypothetical protein [Anaerolineales bacterium]